ncbi:hypothetical protein E5288_WYG004123 [Bos mutus]|uniref:Uncharacterized protein n=1 Tax=Bos mutus TaxID=72004 RepID=A0A6B0RAZ3_9CETA|nr:hypothetical protein [Bos mutus]
MAKRRLKGQGNQMETKETWVRLDLGGERRKDVDDPQEVFFIVTEVHEDIKEPLGHNLSVEMRKGPHSYMCSLRHVFRAGIRSKGLMDTVTPGATDYSEAPRVQVTQKHRESQAFKLEMKYEVGTSHRLVPGRHRKNIYYPDDFPNRERDRYMLLIPKHQQEKYSILKTPHLCNKEALGGSPSGPTHGLGVFRAMMLVSFLTGTSLQQSPKQKDKRKLPARRDPIACHHHPLKVQASQGEEATVELRP